MSRREKERRITTVYKLMLSGRTRSEILRASAEQWGIKERQTDNYMAEAHKRMMQVLEAPQEELMAEHLAERRQLRALAHDAKNYQLELSILQDEARILNIYPSAKIDGTILNLSYAELKEMGLSLEEMQRIANGEDAAKIIAEHRARP